jgi:hypothetical protein
MAEIIWVAFDMPEEAVAVKRRLERAGFERDSIAVVSPSPLQIGAEETAKSRIGICAVTGALMGAASALLLTVLASKSMGLVTGGMPIVAPWPFGIITFELTALGAIAATIARMIFEARLMRRRHCDLDDAIASGKTALVINCEDESSRSEAENLLRLEGGLAN